MKAKVVATTTLIAILSALTALLVYTRVIEPEKSRVAGELEERNSDSGAIFTSLPQQGQMVDFTKAAEIAVHAVVHVKTKATMESTTRNPVYEFFYGEDYRQPREVKGYGSGVIVSSDGFIITNNHVIDGADAVDVTLNDNRTFTAEIVGTDPTTDIALLKIKAEKLQYLRYGDSDALKLGEWVMAVGNPFNLTSTVTAGIVSAKGRSLGLLNNRYRIESFIQTDAALNQGNSGGALVNTSAELVGITSAILSPSGAYAGNSFAVPVNIVKKVVEDLREFGAVQRAIIGVNIADVTSETAKELKLKEVKGIVLTGIAAGGSAEAAGLKENDVVIRFNDVNVGTTAELQEQVGKYRPGDKVDIVVVRDGKEKQFTVTLKNISGTTQVVKANEPGGKVYGATVAPLSGDEKRKFKTENGVKVSAVENGRFMDLGIKKGFVIVAVNGTFVNSVTDIRDATNNETSLTSIEGVQPNGTYFSYQFR